MSLHILGLAKPGMACCLLKHDHKKQQDISIKGRVIGVNTEIGGDGGGGKNWGPAGCSAAEATTQIFHARCGIRRLLVEHSLPNMME